MGLRDQIELDIEGVFLNGQEFAEEHLVDGQALLCVVDESGREQAVGNDEGALLVSSVRLYAKTADLAGLPKGLPRANRELVVDGIRYLVASVADEEGMTRVTMTAAES